MRLVLALAFGAVTAIGAEKKDEGPLVLAISPFQLTGGETATLRLRGTKLKEASEVRVTPDAQATLKEKKDTAVPAGFEAKEVGDNEVVIELTPPEGCEILSVELVTPAGVTKAREIPVAQKFACAAEREPNNGFREAQTIELARPMLGKIGDDKDVDVFRLEARASRTFAVRAVASNAGSLLDPIVSLFDAAGRLLATADDAPGDRDPTLVFTPKTDGPICIVVSDAHGRGGAWHEYRLAVSPAP